MSAAGLAAEGFVPVINNFLFASMGRAYNQIRQSILVDRFNVKFIAREGIWGEVGVSHATIEGWGSLRNLPNLVIINPADAVEAEKATEAMMQYIGPCVVRMEMSPNPFTIFTDDYPFDIGKAYSLRDGKDATIIATGYMVTEAIKAVDLLEKDGLDVGVLNMCTLKPLDEEAIIAAAASGPAPSSPPRTRSDINGLGDAVACCLCENLPTPLVKVGVEDEFGQSGLITPERDELMEHFALSAADIAVVGQGVHQEEGAAGAMRVLWSSAAAACSARSPPGPAGRSRCELVVDVRRAAARRALLQAHRAVRRQVQVRARRHLRPAAAAGRRQRQQDRSHGQLGDDPLQGPHALART